MSGALAGKRVVNTRASHQAASLDDLLRAAGAEPLAYPCIAVAPPAESAPLDDALRKLAAGSFDWLVLTSTNTVATLAQRLAALELKLNPAQFAVASVGPATADAARARLGLEPIDLPPEYVAESLAVHLPLQPGARVLLPESAIARPTLADLLTARGADVLVVDAYRTICGTGGDDIPALLARGQVDALAFTSSSTVTCFVERMGAEGGEMAAALHLCAACIGSKTAATARDAGFTQVVMLAENTLAGLVAALEAVFRRQESA